MDNRSRQTPDGTVKASRKNIPLRKPQPLPECKTENGLLYRLDKETETYHPVVEEPMLGKYGQLLRKYLHEADNGIKVTYLMLEHRYWTFLEEQGERLDVMHGEMLSRMREQGKEPESYGERAAWLNRLSGTAHELVMEELNRVIASVD